MWVKTSEPNTVSPNIYFFVKKSSMYKFTLLCFPTNVECLICKLWDDSIILSWVLHISQDLYAEKKMGEIGPQPHLSTRWFYRIFKNVWVPSKTLLTQYTNNFWKCVLGFRKGKPLVGKWWHLHLPRIPKMLKNKGVTHIWNIYLSNISSSIYLQEKSPINTLNMFWFLIQSQR